MTYTVGYRRPPESGRFKKGASGNPKGRPKGSKNFLTLLDKELNQTVVITENGKKKTMTRLQAITKRIVNGALQGDQKSLLTLVEIMRRTGKLDEVAPANLVPDNYEEILNAYVARRQARASANPARHASGGNRHERD